jgi:hypothetical protein
MKKRTYAREITKEYLKKLGVEHVSEDGKTVIANGKEVKLRELYSGKRPYFNVQFHDPELYASIPKEERKSHSGVVNVGVHILNFVWNNQDKPQGLVVDHIDNNPLNNHISNLQLSTCKNNVTKDRNRPPRIVRMPKYITLEKIESKLAYYTDLYEKAKAEHDADTVHKLRSSLSDWNAKKRMFLENPEKYTKPVIEVVEHECHARAAKKRELKLEIDRAHRFYQELREAYGKDDPIVYQYWGEWKMAIARYKWFCAETETLAKQSAKLY